MSKADKMFEEVCFIKNKNENCDFCSYEGRYNRASRILFNKMTKNIIFEGFNTIDMQELQAINEKAKELGWLE